MFLSIRLYTCLSCVNVYLFIYLSKLSNCLSVCIINLLFNIPPANILLTYIDYWLKQSRSQQILLPSVQLDGFTERIQIV